MFYIVLKSHRIAFIFTTRCLIKIGLGLKCSIFNAKIGCIEKLRLDFVDMRLISLGHITNLNALMVSPGIINFILYFMNHL